LRCSNSPFDDAGIKSRQWTNISWKIQILEMRTIMSNNLSSHTRAVATQIAQLGYRYLRKAEAEFIAIIQRLYAAHVERAQMRLAPTRRMI
jgi:hypothetical protein